MCFQALVLTSAAFAYPCSTEDDPSLFCVCKKELTNPFCSCLNDPNQQICIDYCEQHPEDPMCNSGGTPIPTATATINSGTPTATPQATSTATSVPTSTSTFVPTLTSVPTFTSTSAATATPTANATQTSTPQATNTANSTPTASATQTAQSTATPVASPTSTSKGEEEFGDGEDTDEIFVPTGCTPLEVYPHLYALNSSLNGYYGRIVTNRIRSVRSVLLRKSSSEARKTIRRDFQQNEAAFNQHLISARKSLASIDPVLVMCSDPVPARCVKNNNAIPSYRSSVAELSKVVSKSFKKATSKASQREALKSLFSKSFTTAQTPKISDRAMKSMVKYSQEKIPESSWICSEK